MLAGACVLWAGAHVDSMTGVVLMMVGLVPIVTGIANISLLDELAGAFSRTPTATTGSSTTPPRPSSRSMIHGPSCVPIMIGAGQGSGGRSLAPLA